MYLRERCELPVIRQLVIATSDLDATVGSLQAEYGFAVSHRAEDEAGYADFGIRGAMLPVGHQFIEVVAPVGPGTAVGRHLHRLGGDGGYMVIVQVPDAGEARSRLERLGVRVIWSGGAADPGIDATHVHPRDTGGALLSLVQATPPSSWSQGGREWESMVRTEVASGLAGATIACREPERVRHAWAEALGVDDTGEGGELRVGPTTLTFLPTDGPDRGPIEVRLVARDRAAAGRQRTIAGVTLVLV